MRKTARAASVLLLALASLRAFAGSDVESVRCEPSGPRRASCEIQLRGVVDENDRLFLPRVEDADRLSHDGEYLGRTGYLLGHPFAAPFFPRLYDLQPLRGLDSPKLRLDVEALSHAEPTLGPAPKVVHADFPLRRVLRRFLLETLGSALTLALLVISLARLRHPPEDGWTYPAAEERWLNGGLATFLLLQREWMHIAVPGLWSASLHEAATWIALFVGTWSLHGLFAGARFHDRCGVEREAGRPPQRLPFRAASVSLLVGLALLASSLPARLPLAFGVLALTLTISATRSLRSFEWRHQRKRSSSAPLFFHFSLYALTLGVILAPLVLVATPGAFPTYAAVFAWFTLVAGIVRQRAFRRHRQEARTLVEECREQLGRHANGARRLQSFCVFVEEEWAAARVSLISVRGEMGIVIASEGPEALRAEASPEPRRIGPFLRRACREGHILYAPVAEELGPEFRAQGLKHSSLAIPFRQEGEVRAVLCVMAEEGERIHPGAVLALEIFARELSLEILSAVGQYVAEERSERLLALARQSDAIAVEHMDGWGHVHLPAEGERRLLVAAQLPRPDALAGVGGGLLAEGFALYARELHAQWRGLARAFEFTVSEQADTLWLVSPRDFRDPYLQALGAEAAALTLLTALAKAARLLAERESSLFLGPLVPRLAAGPAGVRAERHAPGGIALDPGHRTCLHELLLAGEAGQLRWAAGTLPAFEATPNFRVRALGPERLGVREFCSILSVAADKKEVKRLEQRAQDLARAAHRAA